MSLRLAALARFPVKGLGGETLAGAALAEGRAIEGDRAWGLAHAASQAKPEGWSRAREFATPRRAPEFARVACAMGAGGRLSLSHPDLGALETDPETEGARLAGWLALLAGPMAPLRLVRGGAEGARAARGGAIHDVPEAHISVGNLASLRALSEDAGVAPDPRRFRMNLWLDGAAPWAEREWRAIGIGEARLRILSPVERCVAPDANPATGRRDADLCRALHARFGHAEFGVYAVVERGGAITEGMEARA